MADDTKADPKPEQTATAIIPATQVPGEGRSEVLHRRKLFGGRFNAVEAHRKIAWHGKHCKCGSPKVVIRAKVMVLASELMKTESGATFLLKLASQNNGAVPVIETIYGKMVRITDAYACRSHQSDLEKACARSPSWAIVEFDRGPGEDKPIVGVPR